MSPFNDLGRLCGAPVPAGDARMLSSPFRAPQAGGLVDKETEPGRDYFLGFARVLLLGLLGFGGLLSLGVGGLVFFRGHVLQASKTGTFDRAGASRVARASLPNAVARRQAVAVRQAVAPEESGALARLEIPRLGFSAAVRDGTSPDVLKTAIGHIAGTALPGEPGTIGLTGRRDTFFRSLDGLEAGDLIRLTLTDRTHVYRVESVRVVAPNRANLLAIGAGRPALTLVTRYAFGALGPSARQLVVLSRPVS